MPPIQVKGLIKTFGATRALDGLDLEVETGQVHGFLGPNGSGKSTTIKVLLGLIRADGGQARVLGLDPWTEATSIHHRVAYVPGEVNLWPNLTGGEVLDLLADLRGTGDTRLRDELCERFGLNTSEKCGSYSRGNRQKVALIAALSTEADLYVFDEPTAGLDPLKEAEFQNCVREIRDEGRTVLLSSHILGQVEQLADSLTIIRGGKTIDTGSLREMKRLARSRIEATIDGDPAGLEMLAGVHDVEVENGRVRISVDPEGLEDVLRWLLARQVTDLVSRPPTLEDLFLSEYRGADER